MVNLQSLAIVIPCIENISTALPQLLSITQLLPQSTLHVVYMGLESIQDFSVINNLVLHPSTLRGASNARNYGASFATTQYILFLDSDNSIEISTDNALNLEQTLKLTPDLIILQRAEANRQIQPVLPTKYNFSLHCIEWNCIWRREHFLNLGGFDERFGPGSPTMAQTGEAFSLCFKHFAIKNTHTIYLPDIKVHHPSLNNSHKSPQRQFQYAYGSHYAAFEPCLRSPSRLAVFWFLRTLAGFGKDIRQAPLSFRARALALYDVVFGHQLRAKS
jgi:hypothetical protein